MKVYGQLERAQLENLGADASAGITGRLWWNTASGRIGFDDGTNVRALLRNDGACIFGNHVTAANNIRFHRGASGVLQFVAGNDVTAEGTLSTALNQISARIENYTSGTKPAAGNAGRVIWLTDTLKLQTDTGAAWANIGGGASNAWVSATQKTVSDTPITLSSADLGTVFIVDSSGGAIQFNLPAPSNGLLFTIVDKKGTFSTNNVTLHRNGSEKIENLAADYVLRADYGRWNIFSDGTDWYLLS